MCEGERLEKAAFAKTLPLALIVPLLLLLDFAVERAAALEISTPPPLEVLRSLPLPLSPAADGAPGVGYPVFGLKIAKGTH